MKTKCTKLLTLALCLVLVGTLLPTAALAAPIADTALAPSLEAANPTDAAAPTAAADAAAPPELPLLEEGDVSDVRGDTELYLDELATGTLYWYDRNHKDTFYFTAPETGTYTFSSLKKDPGSFGFGLSTKGTLYDSNENQLISNEYGGESLNFSFQYDLTANQRVKLVVGRGAISLSSGDYSVRVTAYIPVTQVMLDRSEVYLQKNDGITLHATVLPQKASNAGVTWTSSNPNIATVDEYGQVTTKKDYGEAIITATSKDNPSASASCRIIVRQNTINLTDLKIQEELITYTELDVGRQLTLIKTPSDATEEVVWSSSNPGAVTVTQGGWIASVGFGESIITVSTKNSQLQDTCTVRVVSPLKIAITSAPETLYVGEAFECEYQLETTDVPNTVVTWSTTDTDCISIDPQTGAITALAEGEAKITVTAEIKYGDDPPVATASDSRTLTVKPVLSTGIAITPKTLQLAAGASGTLTGTLSPDNTTNKAVEWTSNNDALLTIENHGGDPATCTVTAAPNTCGTVIVTAKALDSEATDTCTVFVYNILELTTATVNKEQTHTLNPDGQRRGDAHWFEFTAPAAGDYTFYTTGSTDTYGELYNAPTATVSERIVYNDDDGLWRNFTFTQPLTENQVVYLRVRGYSRSTTGAYTVGVVQPTAPVVPLVLDTLQNGKLENTNSKQWYSFTATQAGRYRFTSGGVIDVAGALYNQPADKTALATDDDSGAGKNFAITVEMTANQTLYLAVTASDKATKVGPYSVVVTQRS